ncbi:DUF3574 domain-containing protein (plasmid) [Pseudoalteromonas sp. T1lg65]|uniref:DUF3574 domain-containing protein n=1 Tax=Pseudoalteromonas sp. T1lg65 TaxID=2077101 RepID=UPI003F798E04
MLGRILILLLVLFCGLVPPSYANIDDVFRLRLYFGLSLPEGGAVSLAEWESFQKEQITKYFDGFNVVDSVGYYKGQPERSKIVTVIVTEQEVTKAKELASIYAKKFKQDSVMMVKVPVLEWDFIEAASLEPAK